MTYKINKTDGNLLADIPDGQFDTGSSSLTLIGKNVTNFGESLNENLVKLLENFSSSTQPEYPIKGQLWYNTSTGRLNVYDGNSFRASGGPLVSSVRPLNLVPGDLWINNETNQLWFYDGVDLTLAGPIYTAQQKPSGFVIENIIDNNNRLKVIAKLFVNNVLLGIFSDKAFTPALAIAGFSGDIGIGFTAGTLIGTRFNVTVSRAEGLITGLGDTKVADDILYNNEDGVISGSLTVQSVEGINLTGGKTGETTTAQGDTFLKLEGGNFIIENNETSRAIELRTKRPAGAGTGLITAMYIDAVNQRVGFFNNAPTAAVDITGNLKVSGNLIIQGDAFTINTTTLQIEDKNIELNKTSVGVVTDIDADGGGITLHGTTDKTLTYAYAYTSWDSSENFNLVANKSYKINYTTVLSATELGNGVVNSNLQTLGNLTTLNMTAGLNITGNTITSRTTDLIISSATDSVSVAGKKITNLANLNYITSSPSDVANKNYVDERVNIRPLALTLDISDFDITTQSGIEAANTKILEILKYIAPIFESVNNPQGIAIEGTIAKIHATHSKVVVNSIQYKPVQTGTQLTGTETIAFSKNSVNKGEGSYENFSVVEDIIEEQIIPAPTASIVITRFYKRFTVIEQPDNTLAWEYTTDFVPAGNWNNTTAYTVNDLVIFDYKEWICIVSVAAGQTDPVGNATNWKLFTLI
jgi:hypothetical protein